MYACCGACRLRRSGSHEGRGAAGAASVNTPVAAVAGSSVRPRTPPGGLPPTPAWARAGTNEAITAGAGENDTASVVANNPFHCEVETWRHSSDAQRLHDERDLRHAMRWYNDAGKPAWTWNAAANCWNSP